jgi:hypothetical protein
MTAEHLGGLHPTEQVLVYLLAFGPFLVLAAVLLPLWFDWLTAMRNMQGFTPLRGIWAWPALSIPLIAWWSRTRQPAAATSDGRTLRAPSS